VPLYLLKNADSAFPPANEADKTGLLAVGGDLRPGRLLDAYSKGIFPWYGEGLPILWHSPDPRFVLQPSRIHLSRSLRRTLRRKTFEVRYDTVFAQVIDGCASQRGPGRTGTWLTPEMRHAYLTLHQLGFAHSVESWAGGRLRGGLYGVSLGSMFFGESMFTRSDNASKVALATLASRLLEWDFLLIDCQVYTENLERFGAEYWSRDRFLVTLDQALHSPTRRGRWT